MGTSYLVILTKANVASLFDTLCHLGFVVSHERANLGVFDELEHIMQNRIFGNQGVGQDTKRNVQVVPLKFQ